MIWPCRQPPLSQHVSVQILSEVHIPASLLLKSGYGGVVCSLWISASLSVFLLSSTPNPTHVDSRNTFHGLLRLKDQHWSTAMSQQMGIRCLRGSEEARKPSGAHVSNCPHHADHPTGGVTFPQVDLNRNPSSQTPKVSFGAWSSPQAQGD